MVWKLLILKNWPEFGLGTTLSDMMEECDSSLYYAQNMHANWKQLHSENDLATTAKVHAMYQA